MALAQERLYTEDDYDNIPEDVRVELIDGQFYNQAAPNRVHQEILMSLSTEIYYYINSKGGPCKVYPAPFAVRLNEDGDIFEPDISVICDKGKLDDKGCNGAPDWIIEIISPSTASKDYILKNYKYHDAGVREYWIVNPMDKTITVYRYDDMPPRNYSFDEKVKVGIYDDFEIDFSQLDV